MRRTCQCKTRTSRQQLWRSSVLFLSASVLHAQLGIKPAYVEVNLDSGTPAGVFYLSNLGENEERFRLNAVHFTYSETGVLIQAKTGEHSLRPGFTSIRGS